ncbi:Major sperm protein [Trichuris trichiura]|uniref:Major sperm protein n=1 Tax=Trichuris trichiura TaxID=36087 RepID=A0A077ZGB7_TRITR|nr:Major sperm protein [Trichuris trichiura]
MKISGQLLQGKTLTEKSDRRASLGSTSRRRSSGSLRNVAGAAVSDFGPFNKVNILQFKNPFPYVPGNAMEKRIRKSQEMAELRGQLKALAAMQIAPDEFSDISEVSSKFDLEMEALKNATVSSIDQNIKTPAFGDVNVGEAPTLEKSKPHRSLINPCVYVSEEKNEREQITYEADPNVKPIGYPCESQNIVQYNIERENDRMQRKPDPFFIPPERFIPGVYYRLGCVPDEDEKEGKQEQKKKSIEHRVAETPYKKTSIALIQSRTVKMLLDEFAKKTTDKMDAVPKSLTKRPHVPMKVQPKADNATEVKDESHISVDPTIIIVKEPIEDRKLELFKVRNDGKHPVAMKMNTSNNRKLQVTESWTFLNPGDSKLFMVFFNAHQNVPDAKYLPETVYISYRNTKENYTETKWKTIELKVELTHEAKTDTVAKEEPKAPKAEEPDGLPMAINPYPYEITDQLPIFERPFDRQLIALENELQKIKSQQKLAVKQSIAELGVKAQKGQKIEAPMKSKASGDSLLNRMLRKPPVKQAKASGSPSFPSGRSSSTLTFVARQLREKKRKSASLKEAPLTPKPRKSKQKKAGGSPTHSQKGTLNSKQQFSQQLLYIKHLDKQPKQTTKKKDERASKNA